MSWPRVDVLRKSEQSLVKIKIIDRYLKIEPKSNRFNSVRFRSRVLKPKIQPIQPNCYHMHCQEFIMSAALNKRAPPISNVYIWKISFWIWLWHFEEYSLTMHVYTWNNKIKQHFKLKHVHFNSPYIHAYIQHIRRHAAFIYLIMCLCVHVCIMSLHNYSILGTRRINSTYRVIYNIKRNIYIRVSLIVQYMCHTYYSIYV